MNDASSSVHDVVLVGGGLQSALVALAMLAERPEARVAIVERERRIGGNHTWSFHAADVPESARALIAPLVTYAWRGYDVSFPGFARQIPARYAAVSSDRLAEVVTARLAGRPGSTLLTGAEAVDVGGTDVTLRDGRKVRGKLVIDARGPNRAAFMPCGYQKFVGLELALSAPHGRARPMLMDACVEQTDGFRFFYVLPLSERRVLVEDTYFSDGPGLEPEELRRGILGYAADRGYQVSDIVREERGVLPLPSRGIAEPAGQSPLVAGYAGGFFHPATGYSFPVALRLALHIAKTPVDRVFDEPWQKLVAEHRSQFRYASLLNRMLFGAFRPEQRWNALARFYRMPEETIHRFYALAMTRGDRVRLLCGRPPRGISLRAAIGASV
ncbi:MAG: lycopene beta-cyclase CrtY [Polyangiaceae bacterium]